ncbi:MAG: hypothetical protein U0556_16515 [Dehalococcoidia bacterium]
MSALLTRLRAEQPLLGLLGLFIVFRLGTLLSWRPGGYVVDWSERYFFGFWLRYVDAGYLPYRDFWMEYPPLLPLFGIAAHWLALWLPPWREPALWFSLTTGLPLLAVDAATLVVLFLIGRRLWGPVPALLGAAAWASLLVPLYFFLSGFDGPAVLSILVAIWLALPGGRRPVLRAVLAGVVLGLGMQYKVLPLAVAPAIAMAFWTTTRAATGAFVLAVALTNLAVAGPAFLVNPSMALASYASIVTRSSWETVYALIDGYYGGGLVAPVEQRFDPAIAYQAQHAARLPWIVVTVAAGAVIAWAVTRRHDWGKPITVVSLSVLSLLVLMLSSKGWSAQFAVYPLAFALLLWPSVRGAVYALLLSAVNVLEWPFWLAMFGENAAILTFLVLFRTALLAALAVECWALLRPVRVPAIARSLAAAGAALILIVGTVGMAWAYYDGAYRKDPYQPLMAVLLASEGPALFTDPVLYREIRPFLGARRTLLLLEGLTDEEIARRLDAIGPGQEVGLVFSGAETDREANRRVQTLLAEQLYPTGEVWLDNARVGWFQAASATDERPGAEFEHGVTLRRAAVTTAPDATKPVAVTLVWSTSAKLGTYSVFLHAYDAAGTLVAQRDGPPAAGTRPTTDWQPGQLVFDHRTLVLPPGEFLLRAGFYDASGARLLLADGSDAADLGPIRVGP